VPVSRLIIAAVSYCQDLVDRGAITRTADEPKAFQRDQFELSPAHLKQKLRGSMSIWRSLPRLRITPSS